MLSQRVCHLLNLPITISNKIFNEMKANFQPQTNEFLTKCHLAFRAKRKLPDQEIQQNKPAVDLESQAELAILFKIILEHIRYVY